MITLPQHPEANQVLGEVATELGVRRISAVPYVPPAGTSGPYSVEALGAAIKVDSPLAGAHQQRNVALAIAAAVELADRHGFPITPAAIEMGIRRTRWPGRLERIAKSGVEWILDVAHNPAGAWALRAGMRGILEGHKPRMLVFSCLRDKPLGEMAQILFPLFDQVIVAPIHTARAAALDDLLAAAAGNRNAGDCGRIGARGAAHGARARSRRRGRRLRIGLSCGRGAHTALAGKKRIVMSPRPNPLPRFYRLADQRAAGAAAFSGHGGLRNHRASGLRGRQEGPRRSIASRGSGRAMRCAFRFRS